MAELSAVYSAFQQQQGQQFQPGQFGARTNPFAPARPGFARGTSGVMGSRYFQARNPEAGSQKELKGMQSPIFQAYMNQVGGYTPIANQYGATQWR